MNVKLQIIIDRRPALMLLLLLAAASLASVAIARRAAAAAEEQRVIIQTGKTSGATRMVKARQTIYHDADHPSALVLPVIPRGE